MLINSKEEFWIIDFILNSKRQTFDLRRIFSSWNIKGKIIEVKIDGSNEIIGNNQFLILKSVIQNLILDSLEKSIEFIKTDKRNVELGIGDYFNLEEIEISDYHYDQINKLLSYNIEINLLLTESNNDPKYLYDTRGCIFVKYHIKNNDEIEFIEIDS